MEWVETAGTGLQMCKITCKILHFVGIIQSEHRIQSHDFVSTNQSLATTLGRIYSKDVTIIETDTWIFSPCSVWVGGGVQIVTTSLDNVRISGYHSMVDMRMYKS